MRVLISGFEPFGGRTTNPTQLLVESVLRKEISHPEGMLLEGLLLPVTFREAFYRLQNRINVFNPDVVISFGQAAGRSCIELESTAMNKIDADISDNEGSMPKEEMINHLGPISYPSTLPLLGIEKALKEANLPVKISNSAGTFVCNYLFYRLMEANLDTLRLCGFIHVPILPEQQVKDEPVLPFEDLQNALSVILKYINY